MVEGSVTPSQTTQDLEDTLIPWMLMRVNSFSSVKGKANRASHGPRVMVKERVRRGWKNPRENPKVPKVRTMVKHRKLGFSGMKKPKSETSSETQESAQTYSTDNSYTDDSWCDDGLGYDGWTDDWSSVGWHEGWERTDHNSSSSFALENFDLGAMRSPKRFEWVNMYLDTGAGVNAFHWSGWSKR